MADKTEPVDEGTPRLTADPIEAGEPVEGTMPSQMGATFAERSGKKAPAAAKTANSTFADRAKAVKSADTEDKAVSGRKATKKS